MADEEGWRCPSWFVVQHAATINHIPFWIQAGLPAPVGPDDPVMSIYTNIANDYDWCIKGAQEDRRKPTE
jgi:hypothetical protein